MEGLDESVADGSDVEDRSVVQGGNASDDVPVPVLFQPQPEGHDLHRRIWVQPEGEDHARQKSALLGVLKGMVHGISSRRDGMRFHANEEDEEKPSQSNYIICIYNGM